ncbi:MAG: ROK family protein [Verrucomicrobiota bacterium]
MTTLACDLGGTRMKIGLVREGAVQAQTTLRANSQAGLIPGLPALKAAWLRLLGESNLSVRDCDGISVAFPSLVDIQSGRILAEYGKYADAMSFDFCAWAKAEFNLPLAIENDARMALVGEWKHGAGRGLDNVVMITLGTGLGTAAVIEGRLLRGKHGQAGVLGGHNTVRYAGRVCTCGNVGCAEAEASTAYLRQMAEGVPEWASSSLQKFAALNYAVVFEHAEAGDRCALKLREHSSRVWATLAVNMIHAYDPEIVILGGGVMASAAVVLPAIDEYVQRHAHTPWGKVRVVAGELGDLAALIAGEWLLQEQHPKIIK